MKKILAIVLALVLCLGLTACGGKTENDGTVTIKVGASPAPHAELLELCVEPLAEQGITLEIVTFEDYVLPNTATEDGSID
ncbi:MAG: metal ABC transporter substrate-binding protein, partial [Oscillospiraceae bacterium]|nr:metal ABC transporter substrate-binding protein [Oscillospiraceae bacterium]